MIDDAPDSIGLLTTREVARMYRVHPKRVMDYVVSGRIPRPVEWPGKSRRWRAADVYHHIEAMRLAEKREAVA